MGTKVRKREIDIYRGIAIIFVVLSHLTFNNQLQRIIIHSFNMPAFFIVSGYLYKKKKAKDIFKAYMLPAYIMLILDFGKYLIKCKLNIEIKDILEGVTFIGGVFTNAPLWFLPTLAAICLIMNWLNEKKNINYIFTMICIITCVINPKIYQNLYFWPMAILPAYPFYFVGTIIKERKMNCINNYKITIIKAVIFFLLAIYNGYVSMIQQEFGKNYLLFLVTGLLGAELLYCFSFKLKEMRFKGFDIIGKNSIYILATHYYVCRAIIPKAMKLIGLELIQYNILFQIIITLLIMLGYYFIFILIERMKNGKLRKSNSNCSGI